MDIRKELAAQIDGQLSAIAEAYDAFMTYQADPEEYAERYAAGEFADLPAPDEMDDEDDIRQRMEEDVLSVEVRSGWQTIADDVLIPAEARFTMTFGGPNVDIYADIDGHGAEVTRIVGVWGSERVERGLRYSEHADALAWFAGLFIA